MPNAIKYNVSAQTLALKEGNFWIGTGDVSKATTAITDYWNGISPPVGGYTIYLGRASQGPVAYVANTDAELISLTNRIGTQSFTTAAQSLSWYLTQPDKMVLNKDYEPIVTNGLVLNLDAGFVPSYPRSGTTWYDLTSNGNNGTLINGPVYGTASGGAIVFDGVDDIVNVSAIVLTGDFSITQIMKVSTTANGGPMPIGGGFSANGSDHSGYVWFRSSGLISFKVNGEVGPDFSVSSTKWLNINTIYTVTRSGSTAKIYINGVEEGSSSISTSNFTIRTIGASYNYPAYSCNGSIYSTSIYNRALSALEVLQNFNAQKERFGFISFDSDAQAFITAAAITNSTQQTAINTLVVGLKSDGIWTKIGILYPFVGGNATSHRYNLKSPGSYLLTFYGGWVHSSTGSQPNGTNAYATTGYLDSAYGYNIHRAVYSRENISSTSTEIGVADGYASGESGNVIVNYFQIRTDAIRSQLGDSYSLGFGFGPNALGLFVDSKLGSGPRGYDSSFYRNGNLLSTSSFPGFGGAFGPTGKPLHISALYYYYDTDGVLEEFIAEYNNKQQSFISYGSGLTSIEVANLYTRVQAFQTTLGRQV